MPVLALSAATQRNLPSPNAAIELTNGRFFHASVLLLIVKSSRRIFSAIASWIHNYFMRIFSQPPLISFKRDKNIGNFLVRSAFKTSEQPGTFKCARARCKTCPFIYNVEKLSGPKRSIKITDHFTCTSANVIYCITCTLCKKLYIGETGRRLGDRFREHLRDVEKDDKDASKPVARHFNLPNHSKQHMAVCGLSLHQGSTESRKTLEQRFIFQIGTLNPHGINERFSFN